MPKTDKDPEHQWTIISLYEVTQAEVEHYTTTHDRMPLDASHLMTVEGPGCFRCEMTWEVGKDKPCPGGERLKKDTVFVKSTGEFEAVDRE